MSTFCLLIFVPVILDQVRSFHRGEVSTIWKGYGQLWTIFLKDKYQKWTNEGGHGMISPHSMSGNDFSVQTKISFCHKLTLDDRVYVLTNWWFKISTKSINFLISSFDPIDETSMDFGLNFTMRQRWQDLRLMFPEMQHMPAIEGRTILSLDLEGFIEGNYHRWKVLEELWQPGNRHSILT